MQSTLSQPSALGSPQQNPLRSETHPAEVASKCRKAPFAMSYVGCIGCNVQVKRSNHYPETPYSQTRKYPDFPFLMMPKRSSLGSDVLGHFLRIFSSLCQGARTSTPSTVTLAAAEAAAAAESALSPTVVSATSAKPRICFFGFGFAKSQSPSQRSPKCANLKKLKKLLNYRIMQIASPVASIMANKRLSTCSELRH